MPRSIEPAYASVGAPPALLDVGFVLTMALFGAALVEPVAARLAIALHLLLRIYDGRFSGWRRLAWLALVLGFFLSFAVGFLGYVLPFGQMAFWLAAHFGPSGWRVGQVLAGPHPAAVPLIGALVWIAVIADIFALQTGPHRAKVWRLIVSLALVFLIPGIVADVIRLISALHQASPGGRLLPQHIVPDLDQLPLYAILRSVPSKGLAIGLVVLVLLLPLAAAWTGAWRFHTPRTRPVWTLATAGLAASWIGLGFIGALPPTEGPQWPTLALVAYQVAFFTALPLALASVALPVDARAVFD